MQKNENLLEKIFNTLKNPNNNTDIKQYTTRYLVTILNEYHDFYLFILINVYDLLMSPQTINRECGAKILESMEIKYIFTAEHYSVKDINESQFIYLSTKDFHVVNNHKEDISQLDEIKNDLNLDYIDKAIFKDKHVDIEFTKYNTSTIVDRQIETINDFFVNLVDMLISSEWYKRHGAFLGLISTLKHVSSSKETVYVTIDLGAVVSRSIIILKNDKFNDYLDNKVTAPVREVTGLLLYHIIYHLEQQNEFLTDQFSADVGFKKAKIIDLKNVIIEFIFNNLNNSCWHVQYGILNLLNLIVKSKFQIFEFIVQLIIKEKKTILALLKSQDEDIKYIVAEIITNTIDNFKDQLNCIYEICIQQLRNEEDIAHSKAQIILLIKILIDHNVNCNKSELIQLLTPCFTSIIPEIKQSVVEISKKIDLIDIVYLLSEYMLFYGDITIDIFIDKFNLLTENEAVEYLNHFWKILNLPFHTCFNKDDFILYDETYFTKDGWKTIDYAFIMDNKLKLMKAIKLSKVHQFLTYNPTPNTLLHTFNRYYFNLEGEIFTVFISPEVLKTDCKMFDDITPSLLLEFIKVINDTDKIEYPMMKYVSCPINVIEYIRVVTIRNISNNFDFSLFYAIETSTEVVKYITTSILSKNNYSKIKDILIKKLILCIKLDKQCLLRKNSIIFLKNCQDFGNISQDEYLYLCSEISELERNQSIFRYTLNLLFEKEKNISNIADNILLRLIILYINNKNDIKYSCDFIEYLIEFVDNILKTAVITSEKYQKIRYIIDSTIDVFDYSFNVLLLKILFKNLTHSTTEILSKVICRLNTGINKDIERVNPTLYSKIQKEYKDIEMLLDSKAITTYKIADTVLVPEIKLRDYQIEGIQWMNFIFKFNLGGILADDMGLGKTLQILVYLFNNYKQWQKILIVCPTSLVSHWEIELQNKISSKYDKTGVCIMSYDSIRKNATNNIKYDYLILDEGHLLKNRKTILYSKITDINANHKIILTGTPIHNSVNDIYSLFNIIIPGYLGDEKEFTKKYKFKINEKTLNSKNSIEEKMQKLHKKVLPFILRRLKTDVLKDLPPKIIKDVVLTMNEEHKKIYNSITNTLEDKEINYSTAKHHLAILKDILKAASHPMHFSKTESIISTKTMALFDIINMCGGFENMRNKMIIFFQNKKTLDIVYNELKKNNVNLKVLSNDIKYNEINNNKTDINIIANEFNNSDATILLSTTLLGGLGLNLTMVNIVVFYEHDWNPFNDLQAMDRAHRLGQKQIVNVIRLIVKDTIEEKVMNYQNFKKYISEHIITQQNMHVEQMELKDLLDKF